MWCPFLNFMARAKIRNSFFFSLSIYHKIDKFTISFFTSYSFFYKINVIALHNKYQSCKSLIYLTIKKNPLKALLGI